LPIFQAACARTLDCARRTRPVIVVLDAKLKGARGTRPAGPVWTPYDDGRLRALASSGTQASKIAEQLNRSEAAVRKRAAWLNIVVSLHVRTPKANAKFLDSRGIISHSTSGGLADYETPLAAVQRPWWPLSTSRGRLPECANRLQLTALIRERRRVAMSRRGRCFCGISAARLRTGLSSSSRKASQIVSRASGAGEAPAPVCHVESPWTPEWSKTADKWLVLPDSCGAECFIPALQTLSSVSQPARSAAGTASPRPRGRVPASCRASFVDRGSGSPADAPPRSASRHPPHSRPRPRIFRAAP
jgi:hypothetical protein